MVKKLIGDFYECSMACEVYFRGILKGLRRKAVAERHALPCGVSGFCFTSDIDGISLD